MTDRNERLQIWWDDTRLAEVRHWLHPWVEDLERDLAEAYANGAERDAAVDRAEHAEREMKRHMVSELEYALDLAEADPLFAWDMKPYFKRIHAAIAALTSTAGGKP